MCEATTAVIVAGVLVSAASTGYTVHEERQQSSANNRFQEDVAKQGNELANANFKNQAAAENLHQSEESQAASQQKLENQQRASQAKATARVASGEAGVAGISVDQLQSDFDRQEAIFNNSVDTNRSFSQAQSQSNLQAIRAGALDRIASTRPNPVAVPGYLGASLRVGSTALDAETRYDPRFRH